MSLRLRAIAIILQVVVLDRLTKLYIQAALGPFDQVVVIPGVFNIVHVENPGAAFGLLAGAPRQWRGLALLIAAGVVTAVVAYLLFRPKAAQETKLAHTALAIVLGGALGNLWDRIVRGTVTDFLQVFIGPYEYPSFNVADSAVFIGACLLIIDMLRHKKASR